MVLFKTNLFNVYRDDRCVSDNGKEAWFPYLDERLVEFIQKLPIDQVVTPFLQGI